MQDQQTLGQWLRHAAAHGSAMPAPRRRRTYLLTGAVALLTIWLPVIALFSLSSPNFSSSWTLLIPVTGAGHAVQLDSVGQASSPALSPYAHSVVDPRVNYKAIAMSHAVLKPAAQATGLDVDAFGKPRIKLVDQTALMNIRVNGDTAEQALTKALALQQALEHQLELLRQDELQRREDAAARAVSLFSSKLTDTQSKVVRFQDEARIISLEQFRELTLALERNRKQRDALVAQRDGLKARIASLEQGLRLPSGDGSAVLALQNDAVFQALLQQTAEATATMSDHASRWGARHFKVVAARENLDGLRAALLRQSARITRSTPAEAEAFVDLANSGLTRPLIEELVTLHSELRGANAQLSTLNEQIMADSQRLSDGAADAVALEDLQRKQQVATAVFTTALAKMDLGKTDVFGTYPMLQTLVPPSLPRKPDALARTLALIGAGAGSLFCLLALCALWIRKPYLQKIFRNV